MNRILALWQTAIGKKAAMAVSGVLLVLFLVSHMISNVTVLIDPKHLDDYAAWLRSFVNLALSGTMTVRTAAPSGTVSTTGLAASYRAVPEVAEAIDCVGC
jgi:hypothetical protein